MVTSCLRTVTIRGTAIVALEKGAMVVGGGPLGPSHEVRMAGRKPPRWVHVLDRPMDAPTGGRGGSSDVLARSAASRFRCRVVAGLLVYVFCKLPLCTWASKSRDCLSCSCASSARNP